MTTDVTKAAHDAAEATKTKAAKASATVKKVATTAADKSRTVAKKAAKRVDEVTETTVDTAKRHPVAAAAIAVGTAAAIAGAAFGATKLVEKRKEAKPAPKRKPTVKKAATPPKPATAKAAAAKKPATTKAPARKPAAKKPVAKPNGATQH